MVDSYVNGKNVVVTGGLGLIGRELVEQLQTLGANVRVVDNKDGYDLRNYTTCKCVLTGADYVFHLAGVKGSARMTKERPVDFMAPMLMFDTNMIIAAQAAKVERFLYTSSIALLNYKTDKYPAWAKQTGETLIDAIREQYPNDTKWVVVRPGSVYGRYENYDRDGLMVLSDMIKRALASKKLSQEVMAISPGTATPLLELWDDGEGVRDFINAKDVARGMILAMEKLPLQWVPIGSNKGYKIKEAAQIICDTLGVKLIFGPNKSIGDIRTMDTSRADFLGFKPEISLEDGIKEVIDYALSNRN